MSRSAGSKSVFDWQIAGGGQDFGETTKVRPHYQDSSGAEMFGRLAMDDCGRIAGSRRGTDPGAGKARVLCVEVGQSPSGRLRHYPQMSSGILEEFP